uniref:Uncharacterized protein n=1 Tax=viral metagenome TaxID=1070528 RepID=A0A6H1ZI31_9ZZZZ
MTPQKRRRAAVRGMNTLVLKIKPLKLKLIPMERAYLDLYHMKWDAEKEMTEVQTIPLGMTKKKLEEERRSLSERVETMSAAEATEMLAALERRLNG